MARRKGRSWWWPLTAALGLALAATRLLGEEPVPAKPASEEGSAPDASPPARAPHTARKTGPVREVFASDSPWSSAQACEASLRAQRKAPRGAPRARIGTWNLAWFPDGTARGGDPERMHDVPWLACIIATLDVQALAVQEVVQNPRGRGALLDLLRELDARSAGHWRAELDECPEDGRQHLGFLYDETRVELLAKHIFGELNPARSACDTRLRPGFSVRLRWKKGGPDFDALTVHLDSGAILRDYAHRGTSIERLAQVLPQLSGHKQHDDDVVVLGDFNTMGCSACEPKVAAEDELAAFDASVDALKPSLQNVTPTHPCTEYYKGHGGRLDHVLVTRGMRELTDPPRVETHGLCETLACSHFPSASHVTASVRLSDHCPLVLELRASDLD